MDSAEGPVTEKIAGANIEILRRGKGRPVLFLHPHIGLHGSERFIDLLARHVQVIAPSHPGLDRKSTRLNSSHANISYAVFCLKKKKIKNTRIAEEQAQVAVLGVAVLPPTTALKMANPPGPALLG